MTPNPGVVLLALAGLVPGPAAGQLPPDPVADTLRLSDVRLAIVAQNPSLLAARFRAEAARARVRPAGALPDPTLSLGLMGRPVRDPGRTDIEMTQNLVQLTQPLPWPGTLGYARTRYEHLAAADSLDAQELETELLARATSFYLRIAVLDRSVAIMEMTRDLLRDFRRVSEARYAVGEGLQQDMLQAQVAVARLTSDITVARQDRLATAARLNGLMGRPATTVVPAVELSMPGDALPEVDALMDEAAALRPAIRAARERARAAAAAYRQARREAFPDLMVTVGYGHRPQFDDLATLMVGVSLPVFSGSKQDRVKAERRALQALEEARAVDLHNETYARLAEHRAQAERARTLVDLYRTSILPQARAAVEAARSAYQVGRVDYLTLLTNQMTVNRFEIDRVRLAAEYHDAVAGIDALLGFPRRDVP